MAYVLESLEFQKINGTGQVTKMGNVIKGKIDYDSDSSLQMAARLEVFLAPNESISLRDKVRIFHHFQDTSNMICTLIVSSPVENIENYGRNISIDCYSTLWLLSASKLDNRYLVPAGTQIVNEVRRFLDGFAYPIVLPDSSASNNVPIEFPIGTSYLDVVNQLLKVINYTPVYTDPEGNYVSKLYIEPLSREVDFTYDENNVDNRLLPRLKKRKDIFNVPNKFVRFVNNPDIDLVATYENTDPKNETSTANAPVNTDVKEVTDATDYQTLLDIAKKDCRSANYIFSEVEVYTSIEPNHSLDSCISLRLNGVEGKYIEKRWSFECSTGAIMTHILKEVVPI